jgi:hypothetical protein
LFIVALLFLASITDSIALSVWNYFYHILPEYPFFKIEYLIAQYFYRLSNMLFLLLLIVGIILLRREFIEKHAHKKLRIFAIFLLLFVNFLFALPTLCAARWLAREISCCSNMKQLGAALMMYAQEHNGFFPDKLSGLEDYTDLRLLICPGQKILTVDTPPPVNPDYHYYGYGKKLSDLPFLLLEDKKRNHPGNVRWHYYGNSIMVKSQYGEAPQTPKKRKKPIAIIDMLD